MEHGTLLLLVSLFFLCPAQGSPECREKTVSTDGALELVPEGIPQRWTEVKWKMRTEAGRQQSIAQVERNKGVVFYRGPFFGRVVFQNETLSLRICQLSAADSGVYQTDFRNTTGLVTTTCVRVSVSDVSWSYCRVKGLLCLLLLPSLAAAVAVTHVLVRRQGPPSHHAAGSWGAG
ncbi:uncharacterized protein VSU04_015340 isoform 2-T2 [Chlamydotis macqueenii]